MGKEVIIVSGNKPFPSTIITSCGDIVSLDPYTGRELYRSHVERDKTIHYDGDGNFAGSTVSFMNGNISVNYDRNGREISRVSKIGENMYRIDSSKPPLKIDLKEIERSVEKGRKSIEKWMRENKYR